MPKPEKDEITVYGFSGSILIATTEYGTHWATAVGGVVESRPVGNPFVLFALRYLWDISGQPLVFPEPVKIRINTGMAVTESIDFQFPTAPEAEPQFEPEAATAAPADLLEHPGRDGEDDEEFEDDEDDGEDNEFRFRDDDEDEYVDPDELDEVSELPY